MEWDGLSSASKSDSMAGEKEVFAIAPSLAILASALVALDSAERAAQLWGVEGGVPSELVFANRSGGTEIAAALIEVLDVIGRSTRSRQADTVRITDGASSTEDAECLRQRAYQRNVDILGVCIGAPPDALKARRDRDRVTSSALSARSMRRRARLRRLERRIAAHPRRFRTLDTVSRDSSSRSAGALSCRTRSAGREPWSCMSGRLRVTGADRSDHATRQRAQGADVPL